MGASSDRPVGATADLNTTEPAAPTEKPSEDTPAVQSQSAETPTAVNDAAATTETNGLSEPSKEKPTPPTLNTNTRASAPAASTTTDIAKDTAPASAPANEEDGVNPIDFQGDVNTNNDIPSPELLRKIENYVVLDRHGKTHTFRSLYAGSHVARRVLVIFVRHFFCGNCQEYLRALSASITPDALLRLPISTFIAVVGCGDPGLIDMYASETNCPFPIYADPTRKLYDELGMIKTLALGARPAYMSKSILRSSLHSVVQGLKQIGTGLVTKAGDQRQIGGEFLFEPYDIQSPVVTPWSETDSKQLELNGNGANSRHSGSLDGKDDTGTSEAKQVTWCHRMKNTRDHAEIPELMEILGLDGQGKPIEDQKRWAKAILERKGTGRTMARQMSQLSS
ncbi:hypothetical protein GQ53DRAFT_108417 [Thozetella sp. PMI_491]|nr:hypothetical protein GQ53DRAFT_108417 [Thozetella sp. PMI_491]